MRLPSPEKWGGYFWIPEDDSTRIPGFLELQETGESSLELLGTLGKMFAPIGSKVPGNGTVFGELENGKPVTLEGCFYLSRQVQYGMGTDRFARSSLRVHRVLVGAHFSELQTTKLSRLHARIEGLDEWIDITGFQNDVDFSTNSGTILYRRPDPISIKLSESLTLAFAFAWTPPSLPMLTEASMRQRAYIRLESNTPCHLDELMALLAKLNNFLSLAIDETVSITSIDGYSDELRIEFGEGSHWEIPIGIFYPSLPRSAKAPKPFSPAMLFQRNDVQDKLAGMIRLWISGYDKARPAFNLYFAARSGAHRYLDTKFLALAQGLETLHRRFNDDTSFPEAEFLDLKNRIIEGCPAEFREWLGGRLAFANELPLRERLQRLIEPFEELFGSKKERKGFVSKVVATRNYFTHFSPQLEKDTADGKELFGLCNKLEVLFQLQFLRLMGLDEKRIIDMAKRHGRTVQSLQYRRTGHENEAS